mgnify:CR=1 FL=1
MSSKLQSDPIQATAPAYSEARVSELNRPRAVPHDVRHGIDWWFEALDQRSLDVGTEHVTLQVVGIHDEDRNLWVQIECAEDAQRCVVVRVCADLTVDEALASITAALPSRSDIVDGEMSIRDISAA